MNECEECRWRAEGDDGEPCCEYECPAFEYGGEDCPMLLDQDWEA